MIGFVPTNINSNRNQRSQIGRFKRIEIHSIQFARAIAAEQALPKIETHLWDHKMPGDGQSAQYVFDGVIANFSDGYLFNNVEDGKQKTIYMVSMYQTEPWSKYSIFSNYLRTRQDYSLAFEFIKK